VLTSATTNLSGLLAAGKITNPTSVAAVTKGLTNVGLLAAALADVPVVAVAA
jgi:hypothetical protein